MFKKALFTGMLFRPRAVSAQELQCRADADGPEAQNNLGALFSNSDLPAAAASCYRKAAQEGNSMAQNNLALMYTAGDGVERDLSEATKWFSRAAAQGDPAAQYHLGDRCFRASLTLPKAEADEARIEAFKWLQLSSAQGYPNADACRELVNLQMSQADVAEGSRRVYSFVAAT
ncbi:MAG: sel1 repeat family protein [Verrucomicrobia subdivision 3 bacterium]|nr:sel1 repeat family protein [Limisphaerales bacterium]